MPYPCNHQFAVSLLYNLSGLHWVSLWFWWFIIETCNNIFYSLFAADTQKYTVKMCRTWLGRQYQLELLLLTRHTISCPFLKLYLISQTEAILQFDELSFLSVLLKPPFPPVNEVFYCSGSITFSFNSHSLRRSTSNNWRGKVKILYFLDIPPKENDHRKFKRKYGFPDQIFRNHQKEVETRH